MTYAERMDQAAELKRRHKVLTHFRAHMDLVARLRTGSGMAAITENLSPELIEQLKPLVEADLRRQLAAIEAELAGLGVKLDQQVGSLEIQTA